MPIAVVCPSCAARLGAPDQLIGKKVKCPKCQSPIAVPNPADADGFEVVDDAPPRRSAPVKAVAARPARPAVADEEDDDDDRPRKRRPARDEDDDDEPVRPKSRRAARDEEEDEEPVRAKVRKAVARDEEEEEEEEDDRPRKKRKAAKSKSNAMLLIAGGVGSVVIVGVVAGALYLRGRSADSTTAAGTNWVRFEAPDGTFAIKFPNGPPTEIDPAVALDSELRSMPDKPQTRGTKKMLEGMKGAIVEAFRQSGAKLWEKQKGDRKYSVLTARIGPTANAAAFEQMVESEAQQQRQLGATVIGNVTVTMAGRPGRQFLISKSNGVRLVKRQILIGEWLITVSVVGDASLTADETDAKTYFESFESSLKN
jgi:hypothetical protein